MRTIVLDGAEMTSRQSMHDHLARRLELPDYYGRNLDALFDCLSERGEAALLVLYRQEALREAMGDYGENLIRVLLQAAQDNPRLALAIDGEDTER